MKTIPPQGIKLIKILEEAGYQAYFAGGCVRDLILGKRPGDWDICTSAPPRETLRLFSAFRLSLKGLRYGTLTVILGGKPYEITTFRKEEGYTDHRRPGQVSFVGSLFQDLARRDFTINAMAFHPGAGVIDPFNGLSDLKKKTIRCVGDPYERFSEDALRIIRALRFSSALGFSIEPGGKNALMKQKEALAFVHPQRLAPELIRLCLGKNALSVLKDYAPVFSVFLPEIAPSIGFPQNHPHHCFDVWTHCCVASSFAPKDPAIRLALLFHDLGKPFCSSTDAQGIQHFFGHHKISAKLTEDILSRLSLPGSLSHQILSLVRYHDACLFTEKEIRRALRRLGEPLLRKLLIVKDCDARAQTPFFYPQKKESLDQTRAMLESILSEKPCFSRRDLAVNGNDLMALGLAPGKRMGMILSRLFEMVAEEGLENDKKTLLEEAGKILEASR